MEPGAAIREVGTPRHPGPTEWFPRPTKILVSLRRTKQGTDGDRGQMKLEGLSVRGEYGRF